jgi:uncharacterized protein
MNRLIRPAAAGIQSTDIGPSRSVFWIGLASLFVAAPHAALAQSAPEEFVIGEQVAIFSEILNEERTIIVGKPHGYDVGSASYPVLFLLDGPDHFHHTTGATRFLAYNGFMPSALVVAIHNTNRMRDLSPPLENATQGAQLPPHGGSANFRAFLEQELMPWVEENYRTRPYRILIGHSAGGLFAIDTLLTQPDLFNAYIAISPSLQWDQQGLVERADAFFDDPRDLRVSLFMTVGNETGELLGGVRKLAGVLDSKAPAGLEWRFEHMPLESHGSVPFRSTYHGLEFIFSDWALRSPLETYDKYGIEAIERFHERSDEKYGYSRGLPADLLVALGIQLATADRLDEVTALLSRHRDVRLPAPFLTALAYRHRTRGEVDRAIELYRQVLETNSDNPVARQALTELGHDFSDLLP